MKRIQAIALAACLPVAAFAQSTDDAYTLSQSEFRGTARFMSMGGAFTALGGDLSTLGQNPAGVGIYRGSEIGATLDINMRSYKTMTNQGTNKDSQTKAFCNNFGYVGTAWLGSGLRSLSWGVTYGRVNSFDRITRGYNLPTQNSLSNYIASCSGGQTPADLEFADGYNPYLDSDCNWSSILAYNSFMINENPSEPDNYIGLFQQGTYGDADYDVREHGYVDEYNFDIGGNVSDVVYWGVGIGVTDLSYSRETYYSESMENARIMSATNGLTTGDAGFSMANRKKITGTGWNFKVGVIVRPAPMVRLGMAFHTPTWYNLSHGYDASVRYSYYDPNAPESDDNPLSNYNAKDPEYTEWASFDSRLHTPWRLMFGGALVIGNEAIVSLDYERQAYNTSKVKYQSGYYYDDFTDDTDVNDNIKNCFKGVNIVRLGLEYRATRQLSLRAGLNYQTSSTKQETLDGKNEVFTSGTDASFTLNKETYYITAGIGYKYKGWYFDGAYVYKNRKSEFFAYPDYMGYSAPRADFTESNSSIVLSVGYKF